MHTTIDPTTGEKTYWATESEWRLFLGSNYGAQFWGGLAGLLFCVAVSALFIVLAKANSPAPTACTPSPAITVDADGTIIEVEAGVVMEERKP